MECLEVLNRAGPSQVEQVLAHATVSGVAPLPCGDVGERVLDGNPLAKCGASLRRGLELSELPLLCLVRADRNASAWSAWAPKGRPGSGSRGSVCWREGNAPMPS